MIMGIALGPEETAQRSLFNARVSGYDKQITQASAGVLLGSGAALIGLLVKSRALTALGGAVALGGGIFRHYLIGQKTKAAAGK